MEYPFSKVDCGSLRNHRMCCYEFVGMLLYALIIGTGKSLNLNMGRWYTSETGVATS